MIEIVPDYLSGWRLAHENEKGVQVVTTNKTVVTTNKINVKVGCNTDMLNFNASSGLETSEGGCVRSMISVKGGAE